MKATLKSMVAKVMTAGLLAGAFLFAGPKKAEAAQFRVGVVVGPQPVIVAPRYYPRRARYDRLRAEEIRRAEIARREAWIRHQQWLHHRFGPDPYRYYYGR
jgi:hypothetical protein